MSADWSPAGKAARDELPDYARSDADRQLARKVDGFWFPEVWSSCGGTSINLRRELTDQEKREQAEAEQKDQEEQKKIAIETEKGRLEAIISEAEEKIRRLK